MLWAKLTWYWTSDYCDSMLNIDIFITILRNYYLNEAATIKKNKAKIF